jgi:hypothetical protein
MGFRDAVLGTACIQTAWRPGIQALLNIDKQRVAAQDNQRLRGSVNLDQALKNQHPNDPIWDYGIGHQPSNLERKNKEEVIYWLEVHPATEGEVGAVLKKLDWLKKWLQEDAPALKAMRRAFVWVSSGKTAFTARSPQAKRLAQNGLLQCGRVLTIHDEFDV